MNPSHLQEWLDSGVSPEIIAANVQSLGGQAALELLTENAIAKVQKVGSYVTAPARKILDRYGHILDGNGGWFVTGLDPLNGWERMDWGQLKPNTPKLKENGKPQKYHGPESVKTRAIFLQVPSKPNFWPDALSNPSVPIYLLEGAKKAGLLLTLGYVAIALPGIWNAVRKDEWGGHYLIPDLVPFAVPGRQFIFDFDQDTSLSTRKQVIAAQWASGDVLKRYGCECFTTAWEASEGKGIDDIFQNRGSARVVSILHQLYPLQRPLEPGEPEPESYQAYLQQEQEQETAAVEQAISGAIPFATRQRRRGKGFASTADRARHIRKRRTRFLGYWEELKKDFTLTETRKRKITRYQGYAPTFDLSAPSILLRGWLGAGKTEATLKSLKPYQNSQILWVTGRNGLLRQTAARAAALGFKTYHYQDNPGLYREMLRDGYPGIYLLCPDSLKDYAVKHADWSKAIVVIDEFSGVRREVLKKSAIMPEFERLLTECGQLVAVDAFLSDVDARIISSYRPGNRLIIEQSFQQSKIRISWLETRNKEGDLSLSHDGIPYPILKQWVEQGRKFAIPTDSKLQAKAVRDYLERLGYHGTLCSSETVESNQSLLRSPDQALAEVKFFVYTPTAQSGLDDQTPFDCGLALYSGVISPIDFLQMLGRCRQCKEWYVSAPRRSVDPSCPVPSLESDRVKGWGEKLKGTFEELDINPGKTTGWQLWQDLTKGIEQAFHSEYLYCLLDHFFETVETLEVEADRVLWQAEVKRIKRQELDLTLKGNLQNGQRLLREQKAPSRDSEVWDIALAQEYEKYPAIWKGLIAQYHSGIEQAEALELARLFTSRRLEKIKNWVQATGDQAEQDLADLWESVKARFTSYNSPRWKALQNLSLFQALRLDKLAVADGAEIAHQSHFRVDSPIVGELWRRFQQLPKLQRLFPTVETIQDFWAVVRRCMAFLGYQSRGKTFRVTTPGRSHSNGKDRKGRQRLTESASLYFSGWLPMAQSGSQFFRQNFPLIVQSLSDRLEWERKYRQREREKERSLPPPLAA